jgi:hypothetical protein
MTNLTRRASSIVALLIAVTILLGCMPLATRGHSLATRGHSLATRGLILATSGPSLASGRHLLALTSNRTMTL